MFNGTFAPPFWPSTSARENAMMSGALPSANGSNGPVNNTASIASNGRGRSRSRPISPSSTRDPSSITLFSENQPSRTNGTGPYNSLASSTMVDSTTRSNSPDRGPDSDAESDALTVRPAHFVQNRRPTPPSSVTQHVRHVIRREALRRTRQPSIPQDPVPAELAPPVEPSNRVFSLDQWTEIADVLIQAKRKEADSDERFSMLMAKLDQMREKALKRQLAKSDDRRAKEERTKALERLALAAMRNRGIGNWLSELLEEDD